MATAAERLPVCACRAKQTACWMSRQIQVNSRDDCDGAATANARQTSVAFAAGQKQNAAQRSDRQPEPYHPSLAGPPLSSCELVWLARLLTPWDCRRCMVQLRVDLSPIENRLRVPKPLNLGSTDPSSHYGAVLLGGEEENL